MKKITMEEKMGLMSMKERMANKKVIIIEQV